MKILWKCKNENSISIFSKFLILSIQSPVRLLLIAAIYYPKQPYFGIFFLKFLNLIKKLKNVNYPKKKKKKKKEE